jgi:hypothetical protein
MEMDKIIILLIPPSMSQDFPLLYRSLGGDLGYLLDILETTRD